MAPEQVLGERAPDERCDVWSLCVILHEAISGRAPFDGETPSDLLSAVLEADPPRLLAAGDDLDRIVARGLAKDPRARFQTMRALGEALAAWAVLRGADADLAGTSIQRTWLTASTGRPFSEAPPGDPAAEAPSITSVSPYRGPALTRR
jgi:serine/threonine-protein kinase